jgi:hypothetical protein
VEAEPRYVTRRLVAAYDNLITTDVRALRPEFDVALMVDVIEHLEKPDVLAVWDKIACPIVFCTPTEWFQNPEADQGWPTEEHKSLWAAKDFWDTGRAHQVFDHAGGWIGRLNAARIDTP